MEEIMTTGDDGSVRSDRYQNAVIWQMSEKNKTISMASLHGFAESLTTDNIAEDQLMNNAAMTYLLERFKGPSIKIKTSNWMNTYKSAKQVWDKIDQHYGLKESVGSSPLAKASLSESVLKTLKAAAPACYSVMTPSQTPVFTDDANNQTQVTEQTHIPQYFSRLIDELTRHETMAENLVNLMTPTDQAHRVTEERLLQNLRENNTLMGFHYLTHSDLSQLRTASILQTDDQNEAKKAFMNIFITSFECDMVRQTHKRKRETTKEETIAAIPSVDPNVKPLVTNSLGKSFADLPKNGCAYYYFFTLKGCRFGKRCKKIHDGAYGSLGPFPYSSAPRNNNHSNTPSQYYKNRSNRSQQPQQEGIRCDYCHKRGHVENKCYSKRNKSQNNNSKRPPKNSSVTTPDLVAVIKSLQDQTNKLAKQIKANNKTNGHQTVTFDDSEDELLSDSPNSQRPRTRAYNSQSKQPIYILYHIGITLTINTIYILFLQIQMNKRIEQIQDTITKLYRFLQIISIASYLDKTTKFYHNKNNKNNQNFRLCKTIQNIYGMRKHSLSHDTINSTKRIKIQNNHCCFDSGASVSASGELHHFVSLHKLTTPTVIADVSGSVHTVDRIGQIKLIAQDTDGLNQLVTFNDILYCPQLTGCFINTTKLRTHEKWVCNGNQNEIIWTTPDKISFKLKIIAGNEFLTGTFLTPKQNTVNIIAGFISNEFDKSLLNMSTKDLQQIVETDTFQGRPLTKWENNKCRIILAKNGQYTYDANHDKLLLIHHKLGHIHWRSVAKHCRINKIALNGIQNAFCNFCLQAKQKKKARGQPNKHKSYTDYKPYKNWSVDVWGPTKHPSLHNNIRYQLCFIDRNTNTIKSYPLSDLTQIPKSIAQWVHEIREDTLKFKINNIDFEMLQATTFHLRGDCATYFKSERMKQLCQREKIHFTFAPPDTHSKNAFAERTLQVIANSMKALCNAANLNKEKYWPQAWQMAIKIKDLLPRNTYNHSKSPYELRTGTKPPSPIKIYHPFGQKGSIHIPNAQKLGDRSRPATVMGHDEATNSTLVEVESKITKRKILIPSDQFIPNKTHPEGILSSSYNAVQEEDIFYENQEHTPPIQIKKPNKTITDYLQNTITPPMFNHEQHDKETSKSSSTNTNQDLLDQVEIDPILSAIWNQTTTPLSLIEPQYIHSFNDIQTVQYSLAQAKLAHPQHTNEIDLGATTEVQGLIAKCLTPVQNHELNATDKVTTLLSRYTQKYDNGHFEKSKCRCCFRGESEIQGVHYIHKETHMPKLSSLRLFLALMPFKNEVARKADIIQAFLRAELEDLPANTRRYVKFPKDISPLNSDGTQQIYRVLKSIYGMTSAGYSWEQKLFKFLISLGFKQNEYEVTLFTQENIRILVWVDDILIRATPEKSNEFQKNLEREFGDSKYQTLQYVLGMSVITSQDNYLGVHSEIYINKMISNTKMQTAKPRHTPLPADAQFRKISNADTDENVKKEFQSILGQLNYLATWSRPDLAYTCSALGTVASAPTREHLKYAKHAIAYVKTYPLLGLQWSNDTDHNNILEVFSDASFANERNYKSQSGFVAILNNAPIHWYSRKQPFPALSSTESEIMAACTALRQTLYLKRLLDSLDFKQGLIRFHLDAQNAIRFFVNPKQSERNIHIGVRYHRIRYHINKDIELHFISSVHMQADGLTKSQRLDNFRRMVKQLLHVFKGTQIQ